MTERERWKKEDRVKKREREGVVFGTTSFVRSSFARLSVPRLDTNTDHSLEIYMFPDLHRDIHPPRPVHRDIRFLDNGLVCYPNDLPFPRI